MSARLERPQAEGLVRALAGLLKAQTLYPPGHRSVAKAGDDLARGLRAAFADPEPLLLGVADGYLVVGDVAFLAGPGQALELAQRLGERGLEGVVLAPDLERAELERFCRWLREGEDQPWEGRSIAVTRLDRSEEPWARATRVYRSTLEVFESAYREACEGRIPDADRARQSVLSFSRVFADSPEVLRGLVLIKDYDHYTFHHSVNVCLLGLGLGRSLGMAGGDLESLGVGGLFHDIGKTRTPAEVVRKAGRLSRQEWSWMLRHPEHGRDIVRAMDVAPETAQVVYEHHMRHDGGGYPARNGGDAALGRLSPLITAADVYDAMTTHRAYSTPVPLPEAVRLMGKLSGSVLEPQAYAALVGVLGEIPLGSLVRLASGEVGVVSRLGSAGEVREVRLVQTADGARLEGGWPPRTAHASDIAGWVDPLAHGVDPHRVLRSGAP